MNTDLTRITFYGHAVPPHADPALNIQQEIVTAKDYRKLASDLAAARDVQNMTGLALDTAEAEIAQLRAKLHEIDVETEGGVDGAPDRGEHASLCNRIQAIIHPEQL